ncbi:LytR/AlgR family response regulator transcription factor [Kordia zhangzhouensis]|uniref:LytR/AlgR family response regulator transcription factor n=1 Tax=Kordia zhangzhouensis TaxID=1620405 RepID=UPI0006293D4D|nr:LytTR family DNA-binding domain-containing protein [Kordia zhangzhouensis]
MANAIIIEDEKSSMEYLVSILKRNHKNINILGWATNVQEAISFIEENDPDIVFLDIQLNDGNGFEVLDLLKIQMTFEVIFTTGFLDYKEKAMDYFAFYYLNKPIQETELKKVLDMYQLKISAFNVKKYNAFKEQIEQKNKRITIYEKGQYISVRLSDVIYIEAFGNYTTVYTVNNKQSVISKNLKKVEDMIEADNFYRVHRSFLINTKYIEKFSKGGNIIMSNQKEIPISIRNRKKVLEILMLQNK